MRNPDDIHDIDPTELDEVTGGAASADNPQLGAALQGITSSIAGLAKNNNNSGNSLSSILPLMLMLRGGGGGGGGACPCGCGMANCMRR